ncbi:hypothetical protein TRIUR3_32726 [Triticum urartu]|uniref:Uncharacterized protein n=1 Tax=Triticum urartu TaxID=4572 RepID=M7ZRW5_TRIUA|nr:hypothetical protein TRIUR3_32726 [Triticum urartu]
MPKKLQEVNMLFQQGKQHARCYALFGARIEEKKLKFSLKVDHRAHHDSFPQSCVPRSSARDPLSEIRWFSTDICDDFVNLKLCRLCISEESLATTKMVELAGKGGVDAAEGMEREMDAKAEAMKRVLEMADALRLETLRGVVGLLRPAQAVHFLVAAAELHLAVHKFGRRKDGAAAAE